MLFRSNVSRAAVNKDKREEVIHAEDRGYSPIDFIGKHLFAAKSESAVRFNQSQEWDKITTEKKTQNQIKNSRKWNATPLKKNQNYLDLADLKQHSAKNWKQASQQHHGRITTKSSKSLTNSLGFSHAAKCPPSLCPLYQTKFPVSATQDLGTGDSSCGCHEYPIGFVTYHCGFG